MKTKAEIEATLLPKGLPPVDANKWPKEREGALNVYRCEKCKGALVVVLLDWGTTPFLIGCSSGGRDVVMPAGVRRDRYCSGTMQSQFYRVSELFAAHLSHGWHRPADTGPALAAYFEQLERNARRAGASVEALEAAKRETIEHVERGGLLLRELTEDERDTWSRKLLRPIGTPRSGNGGSSHPGRFA